MYRDDNQREFTRNLRRNPTEAEKRLWRFLRAQQLNGHKFRRQAAVGPYVVDFACFSSKLIIELDGPQHHEMQAAEHDEERSAWLASQGYRVMRFWNHQLDEDIHFVINIVGQALTASQPNALLPPSPTLPTEGRGPEES